MKILLMLLSFSPALFAYEAKLQGLLRRLEKAPATGTIMQCVPHEETDPNPNEKLLKECATAVCGPAEKLPVTQLDDDNFKNWVKPGTLEQFPALAPKINKIVATEVKKNQDFIQNARSKLVDGKFNFDFAGMASYQFTNFASGLFADDYEMTIDTKLPFAERIKIDVTPKTGTSEAYQKGLASFVEQKKKILLESPTNGIREGLYTDEEARGLVAEAWKKFNESYQAKLKEDPKFMESHREKIAEITTELSGNSRDPWEIANTLSSIEYVGAVLQYQTTGNYPDITTRYECDEAPCQDAVKEYLTSVDVGKMITELEKENDEAKLQPLALKVCKANLAQLGLKASDAKTFLTYLPGVKQRMMARATVGFSAHSKAAFKKLLDEIHYNFKNEAEGTIEDFVTAIDDAANEAEAPPSDRDELDLFQELQTYRYEEDGKIHPLKNRRELCDASGSFLAWDSFISKKEAEDNMVPGTVEGKDNIQVSLFSCSYHVYGERVVSHEMGHAMSFAFKENRLSTHSFEAFKQKRACLNERYPKLPAEHGDGALHAGDRLYVEEDMADYVSHLAYPEPTPVYLCALLDREGKEYADLDLKNPYVGDGHSAPLTRVLAELVHKKRPLPPSCQKLLPLYPELNLKACP